MIYMTANAFVWEVHAWSAMAQQRAEMRCSHLARAAGTTATVASAVDAYSREYKPATAKVASAGATATVASAVDANIQQEKILP
jgi:negative regulator of sigma E activity